MKSHEIPVLFLALPKTCHVTTSKLLSGSLSFPFSKRIQSYPCPVIYSVISLQKGKRREYMRYGEGLAKGCAKLLRPGHQACTSIPHFQ